MDHRRTANTFHANPSNRLCFQSSIGLRIRKGKANLRTFRREFQKVPSKTPGRVSPWFSPRRERESRVVRCGGSWVSCRVGRTRGRRD